jgi:DNA/RNA-binding domain of Phe-tRNA-synthetase-like protein
VLDIDPHALLDAAAFTTTFPAPLGEIRSDLSSLLRLGAAAPLHGDDTVRAAVRDLLRHGGYKPTGRGKPASEYLLRAVAEGALGSINAAVDAGNVVSLHSGLPISVVDLDRARPPLRAGLAPAGTSYIFNASGQTIDVGGLLCVFDADGPCASPVKDAQRTKTTPETRRTLSVIWGTTALGDRTAQALAWYRELLHALGARTSAAGVTCWPMEESDEPAEIVVDGVLDLHTFDPRDLRALIPDYLQACRERGLKSVRIIHGKGTGALRESVHALLSRSPLVASFRLAAGDAGGWGATLVELK